MARHDPRQQFTGSGPSEPLSNLRFPCAKHASRPDPKFLKLEPATFVGKYVKLAFDTPHPQFPHEHMWVLVDAVLTDTASKKQGLELIGRLNNDPRYARMKDGDVVRFARAQIEEVLRT